jgi:hypothetical protein
MFCGNISRKASKSRILRTVLRAKFERASEEKGKSRSFALLRMTKRRGELAGKARKGWRDKLAATRTDKSAGVSGRNRDAHDAEVPAAPRSGAEQEKTEAPGLKSGPLQKMRHLQRPPSQDWPEVARKTI